jgi:subtilisin family serine protease
MSLGANVNQKIQQYEVPIRRALGAGTLVVAAAGNNAHRSIGNFGFVGPPANADAAMAVAALDSRLRIADFSARSSTVTGDGGKVNIAGPGVNVYSSWPMATRYNTISGTSMATPHVAGIAALWAQATGAVGATLWAKLTQNALALGAPSVDVGDGLVQAPQ